MTGITGYTLRRASDRNWLVSTADTDTYIEPLCVNDSAAEILKGLIEGRTKQEIASEIAERECVAPSVVEADIDGLCSQIQELGRTASIQPE